MKKITLGMLAHVDAGKTTLNEALLYHGGVIRIPILEQGLFAPYVGKFPPYTKGMFVGEKATCVLSTGLAGSYGLPRFFNPPELVVVELSPQP